jgi:hypothetical protein
MEGKPHYWVVVALPGGQRPRPSGFTIYADADGVRDVYRSEMANSDDPAAKAAVEIPKDVETMLNSKTPATSFVFPSNTEYTELKKDDPDRVQYMAELAVFVQKPRGGRRTRRRKTRRRAH